MTNFSIDNLGVRNRNPLNIRYVSTNHWKGLHPTQPNVKGFCRFIHFDAGYRAAILLMKTYIRRRGCDTVEKIVRRWAPPTENRTELYIAAVCGRSRLNRTERISVDGMQIPRLIAAMTRQETGIYVTPEYIADLRMRLGI